MKTQIFLLLIISFVLQSCNDKYSSTSHTDSNGYKYQTIKEDPLKTRIYVLDNGLKVYLANINDAPRIQTYIAVRAGSTYDPKETTGLAHYLEHMMFKGNSKIGSLNWEKEKLLLEQISVLFELHKKSNDENDKRQIYLKIDSLSLEAANYAVAGEYDKMMSSIGASGTNAWTSNEQTVYVNNIPTTDIEKWIRLESVRFSELTLRLFHTELETVYEEFNMSQDRDSRRQYYAFMSNLFPTHPYGTQTTLGKPEHLKNPSMVNIHSYFNNYYVPNNVAICLSGDIDFDKTIKLIDEHFGKWKANPSIPEFISPIEKPIDTPIIKNIYGPDQENILFGFRFDGFNTKDRIMVTLIDRILANGTAGLIDININQKQKALNAGCWFSFMKHYSYHAFMGMPKEGQSLDEVKDLLLKEIEKIKKGDFDEWLVSAAINDILLDKIKQFDNYTEASYDFVEAFTQDMEWGEYLRFYSAIEHIKKQDLVDFVNQKYANNYVAIYKRMGRDSSIIKVSKPKITPIELNRDKSSAYFTEFSKIQSDSLKPMFTDFDKEIDKTKIHQDITLYQVRNKNNQLFELSYFIEMGGGQNKLLPIALNYLRYIGTKQYSAEQLKQEFFKLGLTFSVNPGWDRASISISGLNKSFPEGLRLLEDIINNSQADATVFKEFVKDLLKQRSNAKKSKDVILQSALLQYGITGSKNMFNDIITADSLMKVNPVLLTNLIRDIFTTYKHDIFYYGIDEPKKVSEIVLKSHRPQQALSGCPPIFRHPKNNFDKNRVYFVDYDMVQTNFIMVTRGESFHPTFLPYGQIFSEYFGSGLSSVVFQEIRESRALAYTAFAAFALPSKKADDCIIRTFVATQVDKLKTASDAMTELMNNMPKSEIQFNASKESILRRIESERITKTAIFWNYIRNKDIGIENDYRKDLYEKIQTMTLADLDTFFNTQVKGRNYNYLFIGNKKDLDINTLKKIGEYKEVSLEELFGF